MTALPQPLTRFVGLVLLTLLWVVGTAGVALADPPGPTNFRTVVTDVSPSDASVTIEVLGGDSYLWLDSQGNDVLLRGYDGDELYLRWLSDGRVEVNVNSRTFHQNESRFEGEVPTQGVGPEFPPEWVLVSTDGTYAWHDHRIHWMGEGSLPPNIDPSLDEAQVAYAWPDPVTMMVETQMVEVAGELRWFPDASPVPTVVAALLALAAVVVLGRGRPTVVLTAGVAVGVVLTGAVAIAENLGLATGVQGQPISLVLPALAALAAVAAWFSRERGDAALVLAAVAGVPLIVWAITHAGATTAPVLPTSPELLVRVAVGAAVGIGLGALVVAATTFFQTPLIPDEPTPA